MSTPLPIKPTHHPYLKYCGFCWGTTWHVLKRDKDTGQLSSECLREIAREQKEKLAA